MPEYQDKIIVCKGTPNEPCGREFTFTASGQKFFAEKGYSAPVRCKNCREKMKAAKERKNNG